MSGILSAELITLISQKKKNRLETRLRKIATSSSLITSFVMLLHIISLSLAEVVFFEAVYIAIAIADV